MLFYVGDVPSPLVAGALKDHFAPGCVGDDDSASTSEACRDDAPGVRLVMLLLASWLIWCVIFYAMSFRHALKMEREQNECQRNSDINEKSGLLRSDSQ